MSKPHSHHNDEHDHGHNHDHDHGHDHQHGHEGDRNSARAKSTRGHDHDHDHSHGHGQHSRLLAWATLITLTFMIVECVGGWWANSLALIADAGHMFTDAAALGLAWAAVHLAQRKPDSKRSFGYHRMQVLATFVNGIALLLVVGWIAVEAVQKLMSPTPVDASLMLVVATIGALVNVVVFLMLRQGDHNDMNISAALLHVIGDLLGSVGAIIAALVIRWTGWLPIDPILSVVLCGLIIRSAWALVRKSSHILLEGAPDWLDVKQLRATLLDQVPGLNDVHHVHCWSLSPRETLLTLHATVSDQADHHTVLVHAQKILADSYDITHSTIQVENGPCIDGSTEDNCAKHG